MVINLKTGEYTLEEYEVIYTQIQHITSTTDEFNINISGQLTQLYENKHRKYKVKYSTKPRIKCLT